jgi:hypothetical protein
MVAWRSVILHVVKCFTRTQHAIEKGIYVCFFCDFKLSYVRFLFRALSGCVGLATVLKVLILVEADGHLLQTQFLLHGHILACCGGSVHGFFCSVALRRRRWGVVCSFRRPCPCRGFYTYLKAGILGLTSSCYGPPRGKLWRGCI